MCWQDWRMVQDEESYKIMKVKKGKVCRVQRGSVPCDIGGIQRYRSGNLMHN